MSESFNDKHLLWWVLKAIDDNELEWFQFREAIKKEKIWKDINAPDWVLPALLDKIRIMEDEGGLD